MGGFTNGLSQFGQAAGQYVASQSPAGRAAYQGIIGNQANPNNPNQPQNVGQILATQIIPRYRSGSQANSAQASGPPVPPSFTSPMPYDASSDPNSPSSPTSLGSMPQSAPGSDAATGPDPNDPGSSTPARYRQGESGKGGGLLGMSLQGNKVAVPGDPSGAGASPAGSGGMGPGGQSSGASTMPGGLINRTGSDIDGVPSLGGGADGGAAASGIGEEAADIAPLLLEKGAIITQPSLVRLAEHGQPEAVVPLTPRAGNKMQPDLLEGHVAPPKPQGVNYSRMARYGQGRGLMH